MTSSQQGSNELRRGKVKKSDKTRRCWLPKEEEILIASLKKLIAKGWKSHYGFRAGYLNKLEAAMKKEFRETDLKAVPHINSKLSAWKKSYSSLMSMLSRSGVGFNLKGNHMIDCDDDQWDQIVENDSNAKRMRYKPYPFLEDWKEIFGKDSAIGENAEDIMDMVNDFKCGDNLAGAEMAGDTHVSPEEICEKDAAEDSLCESDQSDQLQRQAKKKHERVDRVCELLVDIHQNTNEQSDQLQRQAKKKHERVERVQGVCELVAEIPQNTNEQSDQLQRQAKKKRKRDDRVQGVCKLLAEIHRNTNARLMDMVNDLKSEDNLAGAGMTGDNQVSPKEIFEKDEQGDQRKRVDGVQGMCELLAEIHRKTNARLMDMVKDLEGEDNLEGAGKAGDNHVSPKEILEVDAAEDAAEDNLCQSEQSDQLQRQAKKKRKKVDRVQGVCKLLAEIHRDTNARLDNLVNRIGYESDLGKARKELFNVLDNISGLSLDEKFDACEILAAKDGRLQVFMGMPDSVRPKYVMRLLKSKGV